MKTNTNLHRIIATVVLAAFNIVSGWAVDWAYIDWDENTKTISMSCGTEGATIYYTVDGTTPTTSSYKYTAPFVVNRNLAIRSIAVKGDEVSSVQSRNVSVDSRVQVGTIFYRRVDNTLDNVVEVCSPLTGRYEGDVVIPPSIELANVTYQVARIGNGAFYDNDYITSITIPNSVTTIGNYAFYDCDRLTSMSLPLSVKKIEYNAFRECRNLQSVTLNNGLETIEYGVFCNCYRLQNVALPSTLRIIDNEAFSNCQSFTRMELPDGLTEIGHSLFEGCSSLASVKLPATMTVIPNDMFYSSGIKSITIPSTMKSIGENAFRNCDALTSIVIPDGVESLGNHVFFDCNNLLSATIGEGVTTIPTSAFDDDYALSVVSLPSTLITISDYAFNTCRSLTSITIPENVASIGENAFTECDKLTSIYSLPLTPPTMGSGSANPFYDAVARVTLYVKASAMSAYVGSEQWDIFQNKSAFDQQACAQPTFALTDYMLSMSTTTAGATIYYTTDGTDPTTGSTQYTAPIPFLKNGTIRAIAVKDGMTNSAVSEFVKTNYQVPAPVATMDENFVVTINCETPQIDGFQETKIYYIINTDSYQWYETIAQGRNDWQLYEGPIQLSQPRYVHAYAVRDGWIDSERTVADYSSNYSTYQPWYEWVSEKSKLRLYNYDEDATVYYTLDGSDPTKDSYVYNPEDSIVIDHNLTVKWIAMRDKHFNSGIGSYTITDATTKFVDGPITYRRIDGSPALEVEVTSNINSSKYYSGDVVVPSEITVANTTYQVTRIGDGAFSDCTQLTSITLPETVVSIGYNAFYNANQLKKIEFTGSHISLDFGAFDGCYQLKEVVFHGQVTKMDPRAFRNCYALESITIPGGFTRIEGSSFAGCTNLKQISIPEGVTYIGEQTFEGCSSLTSIQLPSTLEKIDHWAFRNSAMQSIVIPDNVTYIGDDVFSGCATLTSVTLPAQLETLGNSVFYNCYGLRSISLPEGLKTIKYQTFLGCSGLTTVQLPSTLTTIGERAFVNCSALRTITLPESVNKIDENAFSGCSSLESVYVLPTTPPKTSGVFAFYDQINSATLHVQSSALNAYNGDAVWCQFSNIQSITQIPTGQPTFVFDGANYKLSIVSQDANAAIYYTRDNSEPTEQSTRYTEPIAFMQNDTVKAIAISEGLAPSLVSEFRKNDFKVPTPTAEINDETFVVTVSCETPEIEGFPETKFYYCLNDNYYNIDYNDEAWQLLEGNTIELSEPRYLHLYAVRDGWIRSEQTYYNYYDNYRLYQPQIYFDSSSNTVTLTHYNEQPSDFYYTLDGSEPSKDNGTLYTEPFVVDRNYIVKAVAVMDKHFNSTVNSYEISGVSTTFLADGIYYRLKDMTTNNEVEVTSVPEGIANYSGNITIPSSVTYNNKVYAVTGIYDSAFNGSKITSITLPDGLQIIRSNAFYSCQSLAVIEIPSSVEEIGSSAFYNCYNLKKVTLKEGLKTIRDYGFAYCTQLERLALPSTITTIEGYTFYGCSSLTTFSWPASVTTIENSMFADCEKLVSISLPATLTTIKSSAFNNCRSLLSITLPESLTSLGSQAFRSCGSLTSIVIPNGIKKIATLTFFDCYSLVSILLPTELTEIGNEAFNHCTSLSSITLPSTLSKIGSSAFYSCESLNSIYAQPTNPPTAEGGAGFDESFYERATLFVQPASKNAYLQAPYWSQFKKISDFTQIAAEQPAFVFQDYKLTLSTITAGGVIYYTCDGSEPTKQSLRYTEPLIFTQNDTVKAITVAEGMANSLVAEFRKNDFRVAQPQSTLDESTFQMTITCETPEAEGMPETRIWYAVRDSYHTPADNEYKLYDGEPIQLTEPGYVHVYAERDGWISSDKRYDNFYDNYRLNRPYIYYDSNTYTITMEHSSADFIMYTVDGSIPSKDNGIKYDGPIVMKRNLEVRAVAVKEKHFDSEMNSYSVTDVDSRFMANGVYYRLVDNTTEDVVEVTSGSTASGHLTIPEKVTHPDGTIYTVTRVGNDAFYNNTRITGITLPSTVTSIGNNAFNNSTNFADVNLPEGITEIGYRAFYNTAITTFVIPAGVKTVSDGIFAYCSQLKSVTIPSGVTKIESNAFDECSQLTSLTLPEGITTIGVRAFAETNIRSITLPSTVNEIWSYAFSDCKNLTSIVIPEGVTTIEQYTFSGCNSLKSVGLPSTLTTIENYAFSNCIALESIILPEAVTNISSGAFNNNNNLRYIYAQPLTHPTINVDTPPFPEVVVQNATLYVKEEALQDYSMAVYWGTFNIETFVNLPCEQPVFAYDNYKLEMSSQTLGVKIYYTLDGTEPTTSSLLYKEPLAIAKNDTIKAMAIGEGWGRSLTSEWKKNDLQVANPVATISDDFTVTVTCEEPDVEGLPQTLIYYSLNRSSWSGGADEDWKLYTEPLKLTVANYLHVRAEREGWIKSGQSDFDYYSDYYLEKPSIDPYYTDVYYMPKDSTITISHSDAEAELYYTLDGSDPNENGVLYTAPFNPGHNVKVTAIAKRAGHISSDPESREYKWFTIATPKVSIEHLAAVITTERPAKTTIYYTLDNTEPTEESPVYTEPIALENDCVIRAMAVAENWNNSSTVRYSFSKSSYTVATPRFSPVSGGTVTENADSTILITSTTADATIYYTLDGSDPTDKSLKYEGAIKLEKNCKVRAIAVKEDMYSSELAEATVNWFQVKQPRITFDGKYVSIETETSKTAVYYTLDNSTPDSKSKVYVEPFALPAEQTVVKAVAMRENWNNSSVMERTYNPGLNYCEMPAIARISGTDKVQMTTRTQDAVIYYTTDGSMPTTSSQVYPGEPITMTHNTTLIAMTTQEKLYDSETSTFKVDWFKMDQPVIAADGIYVSITSSMENARIYYTLDDSEPTTASTLYTGPLTMHETCTIKAIATSAAGDFNPSSMAVFNYYSSNYTCGKPTFSREGNAVSIASAPAEGTTIYYTLDGTEPTTASNIYTEPIAVNYNVTIKAMAVNPKLFSSTDEYQVNWFKVETPVLSLNGSTLTISTATDGAVIYYDFDEQPTANSPVYSSPITIVDNRTVFAVAVKNNWNDSEVATLSPDVFVCTQPTFSYNGRYLQVETGEGMTIHYTVDGTKPTASSDVCNGQIEVTELCTVRAIATRKDFRDSPEKSYAVTYVYTGEDASQSEAGHLADMFQWIGGADNVVKLPVSGKVNADDLAFIRSLKSLRHLDMTNAVYEGNSLPDEAFAGMPLISFQSPQQLSSAGDHLFKDCDQLAAVVWNANLTIPETVIEDIKHNPNFLLYVNSRIYAPSSYKGNLISGGQANSITLQDTENGENFCCPVRFYTQQISYTHSYNQETREGETCGWETISLPFDVKTITHERCGALAPFAKEADMMQYKPFWLYELKETGFSRAADIKAYTPYIISMPNNPNYADDYILSGNVTFTATETYVEADMSRAAMKGSLSFAPAMQRQPQSENILAINLTDYTDGDGIFYESGSAFLPNMRMVRPFEAFALTGGAGANLLKLDDYLWGEVTDMVRIEMDQLLDICKNRHIYDLSGRRVSDSSLLNRAKQSHQRIYIINGKKTVVK